MLLISGIEDKKLLLKIIITFYLSFLAVIILLISLGGWSKLPQYGREISFFLLIYFSAFSLGGWLGQKLLPRSFFGGWQGFLVSLALGLLGLSLIAFLLGSFKLLYEEIILGILIVLTILGLIGIIRKKRKILLNKINLSFDEGIMVAVLWLILVINVLSALSPIIFYDALVYHLNIPAEYLKAHRIFPMPYNMHSNLPQGMGMIYIYALLVKDGIAAKLINSSFALLIALTLYIVIRQWFSRRAALVAMLLFYSMPQIFLLTTLVNVDLGAAFYGILAIFCLLSYFKHLDNKWLILSGIFCGASMGFRYQSIIFAVMLLICFALVKRKDPSFSQIVLRNPFSRKNIRGFLKGILMFCLALLLIFSPWMIKNILYTGNPLFPLFYSILGGRGWSLEQTRYFYNNISGRIGEGFTFQGWLRIFWQVISRKQELGGHRFIFYAAILIIPFAIRRRHPAVLTGLLGLFYMAIWCSLSRNVANILRYNVFSFALLSLFFISVIWQWISQREKLIVFIFILFISLEAIFGIFFCQRLTQSFRPVLTKVSRKHYLSRFLPYYPLINEMNRRLSPEDKVLYIGETRGFYLQKRCIVPSANDGQWTAQIFQGAKNAEEVSQRMRASGITHLLINQPELERIKSLFGYLDWQKEEERQLFYSYLRSRKLIGQYRYIYLLSS